MERRKIQSERDELRVTWIKHGNYTIPNQNEDSDIGDQGKGCTQKMIRQQWLWSWVRLEVK